MQVRVTANDQELPPGERLILVSPRTPLQVELIDDCGKAVPFSDITASLRARPWGPSVKLNRTGKASEAPSWTRAGPEGAWLLKPSVSSEHETRFCIDRASVGWLHWLTQWIELYVEVTPLLGPGSEKADNQVNRQVPVERQGTRQISTLALTPVGVGLLYVAVLLTVAEGDLVGDVESIVYPIFAAIFSAGVFGWRFWKSISAWCLGKLRVPALCVSLAALALLGSSCARDYYVQYVNCTPEKISGITPGESRIMKRINRDKPSVVVEVSERSLKGLDGTAVVPEGELHWLARMRLVKALRIGCKDKSGFGEVTKRRELWRETGSCDPSKVTVDGSPEEALPKSAMAHGGRLGMSADRVKATWRMDNSGSLQGPVPRWVRGFKPTGEAAHVEMVLRGQGDVSEVQVSDISKRDILIPATEPGKVNSTVIVGGQIIGQSTFDFADDARCYVIRTDERLSALVLRRDEVSVLFSTKFAEFVSEVPLCWRAKEGRPKVAELHVDPHWTPSTSWTLDVPKAVLPFEIRTFSVKGEYLGAAKCAESASGVDDEVWQIGPIRVDRASSDLRSLQAKDKGVTWEAVEGGLPGYWFWGCWRMVDKAPSGWTAKPGSWEVDCREGDHRDCKVRPRTACTYYEDGTVSLSGRHDCVRADKAREDAFRRKYADPACTDDLFVLCKGGQQRGGGAK